MITFTGKILKIVSVWNCFTETWFALNSDHWRMQGLFVPFACVGSGDPVRVLRLYTMNTLDTLWSIYCWDICTTCHYRIYVQCAQALLLWDFLLLIRTLLKYLAECALTLYCVVTYICACVDASRTVFWDHSRIQGWGGYAPPPVPIFHFHAFFGKTWDKIIVSDPPLAMLQELNQLPEYFIPLIV